MHQIEGVTSCYPVLLNYKLFVFIKLEIVYLLYFFSRLGFQAAHSLQTVFQLKDFVLK